ncbi:hypothetical protein AV530_003083 [Patagioenas fasciata monilis]|uniref:Uncharacterized protein n=1 Tax=Patagioenas fasciata monilis TaxID=372326 RepID=A0A1V4KW16_PATFA|nr:hypothetical protein AV530_003083 [Patagioenas fasciata monilis]
MKCFCFTREAREFHTQAHPVNFKDAGADVGWESSPALHKLLSPQEPPLQRVGGAGRAYGAGTLPWMSRKDFVGLWLRVLQAWTFRLLQHFYTTSGSVMVPTSLSWTRHCMN